ncbi:hypothetical protein EG68_03250 [Paragonimus skrjabini miyazakii]|uniref:Uncharacterized protein n=1 Tax=Paragonimus skrjabini miyazakii TaxID=59628 RepID=A0A8S9Z0U5_9TREM|nr:hypothetical protein EG68_03250 [Paragonimus skrjabini miyazakii]
MSSVDYIFYSTRKEIASNLSLALRTFKEFIPTSTSHCSTLLSLSTGDSSALFTPSVIFIGKVTYLCNLSAYLTHSPLTYPSGFVLLHFGARPKLSNLEVFLLSSETMIIFIDSEVTCLMVKSEDQLCSLIPTIQPKLMERNESIGTVGTHGHFQRYCENEDIVYHEAYDLNIHGEFKNYRLVF